MGPDEHAVSTILTIFGSRCRTGEHAMSAITMLHVIDTSQQKTFGMHPAPLWCVS